MKFLITIVLALSLQVAFAEEKDECPEKHKPFITNTWLGCKAACYRYDDALKLDKCLEHCMGAIDHLKEAVCHDEK